MSYIYKYTLSKISNPGFRLDADHIQVIYTTLKFYICNTCLSTDDGFCEIDIEGTYKAQKKLDLEMDKPYAERDQELIKGMHSFLVDNYLLTACGLEFELEIKTNFGEL